MKRDNNDGCVKKTIKKKTEKIMTYTFVSKTQWCKDNHRLHGMVMVIYDYRTQLENSNITGLEKNDLLNITYFQISLILTYSFCQPIDDLFL